MKDRESSSAQRRKSSPSANSGVPTWITPELIELTLRVWQPYYSQPLTTADAVAMLLDVAQLFNILSDQPQR